jgi:hypothetical protein
MRTSVLCTLASTLLIAACADPESPVLLPDDAGLADVGDGAHGGNPAFFFLPPLVPAPTYSGVFDPSLAPVVTICAWSGVACGLPPVAEFSTTTGEGSEIVRVDMTEEHYIVNWHTRRFALVEQQVYRIRVLLDQFELGHADVVMTSGGNGHTSGTPDGVIPVKNGRTLPIKFRIEEGAVEGALGVVIGYATGPVPRADACGGATGRSCESKIGNVVADAMRTAYGTDVAIMNSGALRADLTCPATDVPSDFCPAFTPPPYPITRGQVYAVMPFGNKVVTLTINGAELKTMLENGVSQAPDMSAGRFPQVSGLCFTYGIGLAAGSRVTGAVRQAADGSCTGPALDLTATATYSLASNDFMMTGGDGYPNFSARMTVRELLDQVVADRIAALGTINPAIQGRIVCTTGGAPACPVVTP